MAFICNITFVTAPEREGEFLEWLRGEALPVLFNAGSPALEPRILTVVTAGGEKPGPEHGSSIALQAGFDTEADAQRWHDTILPEALGSFSKRFGPHAAYFVTLLKTLPL